MHIKVDKTNFLKSKNSEKKNHDLWDTLLHYKIKTKIDVVLRSPIKYIYNCGLMNS